MQTVDTGVSQEALVAYLQDVGYWPTPAIRERYAYVLSPSAYLVSPKQHDDLQRLALHTYAAVQRLAHELAEYDGNAKLAREEMSLLTMAKRHTKGLLAPGQAKGAVPPVLKVDLVQDEYGAYQIAEVDSYNPRGFAYLAFLDGSLAKGSSCKRLGPGVDRLAYLVRESCGMRALCIASDFERFYQPSFGVLKKFLEARGLEIIVRSELELTPEDLLVRDMRSVLWIPQSMDKNASLRDYLLGEWSAGRMQFFYPPTAYLGSKAFLPYLREQPGMAEFMPPTHLVCKRHDPRAHINGTPVVLKGVMASGLKQVYFSDVEPEKFVAAYESARRTKNPQSILQHQVPQRPTSIVIFNEAGKRTVRDYYLRITAYVTADGLMGAEVTGRPDRAVHGAPDCIQIPAALPA